MTTGKGPHRAHRDGAHLAVVEHAARDAAAAERTPLAMTSADRAGSMLAFVRGYLGAAAGQGDAVLVATVRGVLEGLDEAMGS